MNYDSKTGIPRGSSADRAEAFINAVEADIDADLLAMTAREKPAKLIPCRGGCLAPDYCEKDGRCGQAPEWALGASSGQIEPGAVLPTRDGRVMGNATVTAIVDTDRGTRVEVLTDAGQCARLTYREAEQIFHRPEWIARAPVGRHALAARWGASPQERAECDCQTPDVCAIAGCSPGSKPETFDPWPWQDVAMATLAVAGVVTIMVAVARWIGGAG